MEAAAPYANELVYLFLGGFMLAQAMQRWNLHRRIALRVVMLIGSSPSRIVLGFMIAAAALSMWVSNTATAAMMMPIGVAVIREMAGVMGEERSAAEPGRFPFAVCLMIGTAYAASIGGFATLIGTPPERLPRRIPRRQLRDPDLVPALAALRAPPWPCCSSRRCGCG